MQQKLKLKHKFVIFMSIIAVVAPIILISLFAFIYYHIGVESIFNAQMRKTLHRSLEISETYIDENINKIKDETISIANELNHLFPRLYLNADFFQAFLDQKSNRLMLSEIAVYHGHQLISSTTFSIFTTLHGDVEDQFFRDVPPGVVEVHRVDELNKLVAVLNMSRLFGNIKLDDAYLVVTKQLDDAMVRNLVENKQLVEEYHILGGMVSNARTKVLTVFALFAALIVIVTIIFANYMSNLIIGPINALVAATRSVAGGDYSFKIRKINHNNEIAVLEEAFNNMVRTISKQHNEVISVNHEIQKKKDFIAGILSSLSSGVITLDSEMRISSCNSAVTRLLKLQDDVVGKKCDAILPEISHKMDGVYNRYGSAGVHDNIEATVKRPGNRYILMKVMKPDDMIVRRNDDIKVIITLSDITKLVAAQRFSAWAEIARRIAHEIKNPLTPIRLVTERLQSKFASQISNNKDQFNKYISNIANRVDDISDMVDEFVKFAKMSSTQMREVNLVRLVQDVVSLQGSQYGGIDITLNHKNDDIIVYCDDRQMCQVFTNIVKNAAESVCERYNISENMHVGDSDIVSEGYIHIDIHEYDQKIEITVKDNGVGIDPSVIDKVCEPYTTTKNYGTGLGLAIVKKIVDEHNGDLEIANNGDVEGKGAVVTLVLPRVSADDAEQ